jgi:Na+/proline symporter
VFFFISKILGAAVRFLVVCVTLQMLVFEPLHIPFIFNVIATIALIFLYTLHGGVKTVIWTDTLKSLCLILSVVLCIYFIASALGHGFWGTCKAIAADDSSRMFFFDNPKEGTYFWKQFVAGIFMVIAMTGLDQDLMQRTLASKNVAESKKGLIVSGITQIFVVGLFLVLGTLLVLYSKHAGIAMPEKNDALFGTVVQHETMPVVMLILFVLGLIAAGYSAAGSALTALTTSFMVDIMGKHAAAGADEAKLARTRRIIHIAMAVAMGIIIYVFFLLNNDSAIKLVYALASYTYGPILGLFAYCMMTKWAVRDKWVPLVCVAAPVLSLVAQWWLKAQFGYEMSFELLLLNAALTMLGLLLLKRTTA